MVPTPACPLLSGPPTPCTVGSLRNAILTPMNAVRGRVRGGRIELDGALPEGAEVVVLASGQDESFDLDDDQLTEIETRMAEADRGEVEPATTALESLRRRR
jgi:hypothetical protein